MAGGLIELVNYGSQDLYLTGTPEITFFKVVYRKYGNFAIDSIKVNFDDQVGFGLTSSVILPKSGDLINKMYLEVVLPEINFKRDLSNINNINHLNLIKATENYNLLQDFFELNRKAYLVATEIFKSHNSNSINNLLNKLKKFYNNNDFIVIINKVGPLINNSFSFKDVNILDIIEDFDKNLENKEKNLENKEKNLENKEKKENKENKEDKEEKEKKKKEENLENLENLENVEDQIKVENLIKLGFNKATKINQFFFDNLREVQKLALDDLNKNIKFAWIDKIGHFIIDYVEVLINGERIERHYGDWINIWYELTSSDYLQKTYFELIGNVDILTQFNRVPKPQYKLKIPLVFWFCRYTSSSLPLISLEHADLTIQVKFKNLVELCYIEPDVKINDLFLDEVVSNLNVNISSCLYVDYVSLDTPERKRFAQSSHEYLIDQVQVANFEYSQENTRVNCLLDNFYNPCKELIWVSQKKKYVNSLNNSTQLRYDNYSLSDFNIGNPIKYSTLEFNGETRVLRLPGAYFNYLQPEQHHSRTPGDGINVYSFALFPEEQQPSCSANLGRLTRVQLILEFDEDEEARDIRVYSRTVNILRFMSGTASLAFTYGG